MNLSQRLVESDVSCLVCNGTTQRINVPELMDIKTKLAALLGSDDIFKIPLPSYQMNRCNLCALEFANPMTPGSNLFYEWITSNSNYYPKERWEWRKVIDAINQREMQKRVRINILDVGCGSGGFLKQILSNTHARSIGIDFTESSINACLAQGFEAFCCDIGGLKNHLDDRFHIVTLFHVLEHVPDPVSILDEVKSLLDADGSIFVSTPYSPMSIEENWFDPLNHPPHHLTRWNSKAYEQLGRRLNLGVKFYTPASVSSIRRTVNSINIRLLSPFVRTSRFANLLSLIKFIVFNPFIVIREVKKQRNRKLLFGDYAPDSILVEFYKK